MSDYRETLERLADAYERTANMDASPETKAQDAARGEAIRKALAEVDALNQPVLKSEWEEKCEEVERLKADRDGFKDIARNALAEVERLKAERGEFSDVLHRATLAEAKIDAALAIARSLKEQDQPMAGLGVSLEKALTGGREPTYPCDKCGTPRTKAEGGTTFTVCDACWDKHRVQR